MAARRSQGQFQVRNERVGHPDIDVNVQDDAGHRSQDVARQKALIGDLHVEETTRDLRGAGKPAIAGTDDDAAGIRVESALLVCGDDSFLRVYVGHQQEAEGECECGDHEPCERVTPRESCHQRLH